MPLYRTAPDRSLDDLVAQIEAKGEEIVDRHREENGEWSVLTRPLRFRSASNVNWPETRSA